jgi:uncharacterized membrane protein YtjA (UPF0391 family)
MARMERGLRGTAGPQPDLFCSRQVRGSFERQHVMSILRWAVIMLLVSLVAALFGFTDLSAASADVAKVLFYIFVVIFVVLLVLGMTILRR